MHPFLFIGVGEGSDRLDDRIGSFIVEARVEEELSKPTKYAVRFEEDVCEGELLASGVEQLQPGQTLSVLTRESDDSETLSCLVRGPITGVKTSAVAVGGPAYYEVTGQDERVVMARDGIQADFEGLASEAVESILDSYGFTASVEETSIRYQDDAKLTFTGTALAFVERVARENNLEFWVEYAPVEDEMPVEATFRVQSSPPRGAGMGATGPISLPLLEPDGGKCLQVAGAQIDCPNVLSFELDVDVERASRLYFQAIDAAGEVVEEEVTDPQPPTGEGGDALAAIDGIERKSLVPTGGDPREARLRAEAEATENGWFVKAKASVALHATGFVPRPHDIVEVKGVGAQYEGAYQVSEAIHVLNGAGVISDLKLRRNVLNENPDA